MLGFRQPKAQVPTAPPTSVYHGVNPWGVLTVEALDANLPYPWRVAVSGGPSPLKVHGRGLYTDDAELQRWIETRAIPAIAHINRAFDGTDASPRREAMAEEIVGALGVLDPAEVPAAAVEHVAVATPEYRERLVGALYFIFAYNVPEEFVEHRAGALAAALERPPFDGPRDDHSPVFQAASAMAVQYARRHHRMPWTVPTDGSRCTDRVEAMAMCIRLARLCAWADVATELETEAAPWEEEMAARPAVTDSRAKSAIAQWLSECKRSHPPALNI